MRMVLVVLDSRRRRKGTGRMMFTRMAQGIMTGRWMARKSRTRGMTKKRR